MRARSLHLLAPLAAVAALVGACSTVPEVTDTPEPSPPAASVGSAAAAQERCEGGVPRTASFPALPPTALGSGLQAEIRSRGILVVGVSSDSYLLGAFKPGSVTEFAGFDIDVAREVASAIIGKPAVQFKVITAADRVSAVNAGSENGGVDLVARNMTMTCDRWEQVNFSAVYFQAAQQTLVRRSARERSLAELGKAGATICAPKGSTSLNAIPRLAPGAKPYGADQHTACLALLQEGRVDAITGDNTVLAGLVAQDPDTKVLPEQVTREPYGLAVAKRHPEFAQYVNGVLQRMIDNGTWRRLYDTHFADRLPGAVPPPPRLQLTRPLPRS